LQENNNIDGTRTYLSNIALLRLVGKLSFSLHAQPKPGGENIKYNSNHTLGE